jgi:ribosomal subunit interface protein
MKIKFSARHFEATDQLREFVTSEIEHLSRFFEGRLSCDVVLEENGNNRAAEIRLNMLGKVLPVRVEGTDFYKLIPKGIEKLEKQMQSQKSKVTKR